MRNPTQKYRPQTDPNLENLWHCGAKKKRENELRAPCDRPTDSGIVNRFIYLSLPCIPVLSISSRSLFWPVHQKMLNGTGIRIFTGASLPRLVLIQLEWNRDRLPRLVQRDEPPTAGRDHLQTVLRMLDMCPHSSRWTDCFCVSSGSAYRSRAQS